MATVPSNRLIWPSTRVRRPGITDSSKSRTRASRDPNSRARGSGDAASELMARRGRSWRSWTRSRVPPDERTSEARTRAWIGEITSQIHRVSAQMTALSDDVQKRQISSSALPSDSAVDLKQRTEHIWRHMDFIGTRLTAVESRCHGDDASLLSTLTAQVDDMRRQIHVSSEELRNRFASAVAAEALHGREQFGPQLARQVELLERRLSRVEEIISSAVQDRSFERGVCAALQELAAILRSGFSVLASNNSDAPPRSSLRRRREDEEHVLAPSYKRRRPTLVSPPPSAQNTTLNPATRRGDDDLGTTHGRTAANSQTDLLVREPPMTAHLQHADSDFDAGDENPGAASHSVERFQMSPHPSSCKSRKGKEPVAGDGLAVAAPVPVGSTGHPFAEERDMPAQDCDAGEYQADWQSHPFRPPRYHAN